MSKVFKSSRYTIRRVACEPVEQRLLFAFDTRAADFSIATGGTSVTTLNGEITHSWPFDYSDPEKVKAAGSTVILAGDGAGGAVMIAAGGSTGTTPHSRPGVFSLPTIRADGSVDIVGTSDADVITAERVIGVHQVTDVDGNQVNGQHAFISSIGADGKRQLSSYFASDPSLGQIGYIERLISDIQNNVDQPNPLPTEDGEVVYEYNLPVLQKDLADKKARLALLTNGDFTKYTLNGVYEFFVENDPSTPAKATIRVDSGAGNDIVNISSNVVQRTKLSGGSGADKLTSGVRHADLLGGGGNDVLISRSTRGGTLDGGKGSDRYFNRATTGSEVQVLGRNDGDRLITGAQAVPIRAAGLFGSTPIDRRTYFLVQGSDGQVDLLA